MLVLEIRKSTENDKENISNLLKMCFGNRDKYGATDNLENRYILVYDKEKLIAMTGLIEESPDYYGAEIDWTCVHPDYRRKGIVTKIVSIVIEGCEKDIYCSCLRLYGTGSVNLQYCMDKLDFQCVKPSHKKFFSKYTKVCNDCIYKLDGGCKCEEDLYIRFADGFHSKS